MGRNCPWVGADGAVCLLGDEILKTNVRYEIIISNRVVRHFTHIDLTDWWGEVRSTDGWLFFGNSQSSDVITWNRTWYTMWHDIPNDSCFGNSLWSLYSILKMFYDVIWFSESENRFHDSLSGWAKEAREESIFRFSVYFFSRPLSGIIFISLRRSVSVSEIM